MPDFKPHPTPDFMRAAIAEGDRQAARMQAEAAELTRRADAAADPGAAEDLRRAAADLERQAKSQEQAADLTRRDLSALGHPVEARAQPDTATRVDRERELADRQAEASATRAAEQAAEAAAEEQAAARKAAAAKEADLARWRDLQRARAAQLQRRTAPASRYDVLKSKALERDDEDDDAP